MRFHIGMSFKPKDIVKWVLLIFTAICGFLGVSNLVHAEVKNSNTTGAFSTADTGGTSVVGFNQVTGLQTSTVYLNTDTGAYLNLAYVPTTTIQNMYKNTTYVFKFYVSEACNSSLDCNTDYQGIRVSSFKITASGTTWTLSNVTCVNKMLSSGYIQCNVVPENDYTNITFIRGSFRPGSGTWAMNSYTLNANFDFSSLNNTNYNSNFNQVNENINNLTNVVISQIQTFSNGFSDMDATMRDPSIDMSQADGFFGDFEDNNHGLSGIITAPLVVIRGLNNGTTCDSLSFSVLGKNVSMPSGCILWDNVPSNVENIYFVLIGGFLAYILVTRLFHDINNLKDPNKSEVDTLDL